MTFYDKLIKNWECGLFTVVKDGDGEYYIVTFKDGDENLLLGLSQNTEKQALNKLHGTYHSEQNINSYFKESNHKIVRTIHSSELMGKGYKVGDKINVKELIKGIGTITKIDILSKRKNYISFDKLGSLNYLPAFYTDEHIEPYFENEKPEEMVDIDGKEFSKSTIKNALKEYIK